MMYLRPATIATDCGGDDDVVDVFSPTTVGAAGDAVVDALLSSFDGFRLLDASVRFTVDLFGIEDTNTVVLFPFCAVFDDLFPTLAVLGVTSLSASVNFSCWHFYFWKSRFLLILLLSTRKIGIENG